jgi:hypothetical protein
LESLLAFRDRPAAPDQRRFGTLKAMINPLFFKDVFFADSGRGDLFD